MYYVIFFISDAVYAHNMFKNLFWVYYIELFIFEKHYWEKIKKNVETSWKIWKNNENMNIWKKE